MIWFFSIPDMFKDDMSIINYKYFLDAYQGSDEHLNETQKTVENTTMPNHFWLTDNNR